MPRLHAPKRPLLLGALSVGAYPLAFYTFMHLAGAAAGTVVSIGLPPLASALIEWIVDRRRLPRCWVIGAALGLSGTVLLWRPKPPAPTPAPGPAPRGRTVFGVGLAWWPV
ncbi:hypothetical protein [Streptomyces sp. NPDC002573]|uniref:hypothetical protein n=1 Tax=Streptomyces sp. NPDC002573 TaxID=3364651 RepID=UPI0036959BE0